MATDGITRLTSPDDELTRLRQENELLRAERLQWLEDRKSNARTIEQLQHQLQQLLRRLFGRSAEKIDPRQMVLFETLLNGLAPRTDAPIEESSPASSNENRNGHGRRRLPSDLPRQKIVHDLPEDQKPCPCCGTMRHVIGQEVSEQLDYVPAKLTVLEHVRLTYACRHCEKQVAEGGSQVVTADKPASPIEKGLAAPGLLSYVIVSKYSDHLPLYRLADVLQDTTAPVWIVEGEKAADACVEQGLIAVCCGGGASQRTFGNTLDVLRDREVILWPDADEPGSALMGRIHSLLPHSKFVRPVVEPKGDAWDYFAGGGTVAALYELLSESSPTVSVPALDAVTVDIPIAAGLVRCEFTELMSSKRSVDSALRITVNAPGKRRTPFSTRLNLESSSGREGLRRELEQVYGKADIQWAAIISEACDLAKETWRGIDHSVDLADVALPEERQWAVERFAPEGAVTIPFGMGGSCKSYIVADIALCCMYGMPWMGRATKPVDAVLVIDYEDREDEWRLRVQQIADGHGWPFPERGYRYLAGNAIPLADQVTRIKRLVDEHNIGMIVVDSAASACGDELKDANSPSRMINALQALGVTALVIAHNTKAEDSNYPYGSIFFHNLSRATHYIEASQEEGSNVVEVVVWNRKANRGKQKPIPVRVTFPEFDTTGPVTIDLTASIPASLQSDSSSQRWQVLEFVKNSYRPVSARDISEGTGIPEPQVRTSLSKNKSWYTSPQRGLYAALSDREEAVF